MQSMFRLASCVAALFAALAFAGCSGSEEPVRPESLSLTATPEAIHPGESSQLAWQTRHADRVELRAGERPIGGSLDPASGSAQVTPEDTTSYELRAFG